VGKNVLRRKILGVTITAMTMIGKARRAALR
jgi:hypothetical protein